MKAVFLDRDGVLIEDTHLLTETQSIRLMPGAGAFVARLRRAGMRVFVISNQTVVSRGLVTYEEAVELNEAVLARLLAEDPEARVDESFLCPHHPRAQVEAFRQNCECRKPKPGMILDLAKRHGIDLSQSFLVGDRVTDIVAGNLAGVRSLQLVGPTAQAAPIESDLAWTEAQSRPWARVETLRGAADTILGEA